MIENRNGIVVDGILTLATGTAEREAALEMVAGIPGASRITIGLDKGYDIAGLSECARERNCPRVTRKKTPSMK